MAYVMTCPVFNDKPSQYQTTLGNRSEAQKTLGDNDVPSYYFDLVTPYGPWSAADIINYLIAGYTQPQLPPSFEPIGPTWVLSDPLELLSYIPEKIDLNGKSLLACLNSLVNPRRGLTWRAYPTGSTITITIYSTSPVDLTVGDTTIAASSLPVDLDWTGNPFIPTPEITEDTTSQFDYIQVMAAKPLAAITGTFTRGSGSAANAFVEGWYTGYEPVYGGAWDPSLNQGPEYENVYRRFVLVNGWNGLQQQLAGSAANVGLRNLLAYTGTGGTTLAQIAAFGWGGYTGARSFSATTDDNTAPSRMLALDKFIPLPYASYTTTPSIDDVDMTQPLLAPCLYVYDANGNSGAGSWQDITDEYDIDIEQNPPAVVLSGDMEQLQGFVTGTNFTLCITLGIREADPLIMSWQNATEAGTNYVSQVPRVMVRTVPYIEQWIALQGTILGIAPGADSAYTLSTSLITVDDTPKLAGWLAYLRAWFGNPDVTCSWTDHSGIDTDTDTGTFQPGALVATVNRGDAVIPCNGIVTSRAWDFTDENWGTSYTTERIIPDIDALDGHPRITRIWKSQDERLGTQ
jgi:hypothetical protein